MNVGNAILRMSCLSVELQMVTCENHGWGKCGKIVMKESQLCELNFNIQRHVNGRDLQRTYPDKCLISRLIDGEP